MGNFRILNEVRFRQIQTRQNPPGWGKDYVPAILATREEAPSGSRPCKIYSQKFGRDLHTLSTVERDVMLIALYHPNLVDMHEQRVLSFAPCQHPLQSHPLALGKTFPLLRGTVNVAEALDLLSFHPVFNTNDPDDPAVRITAPFPWIGDFLIFLNDDAGLYCVNWTIKNSADQFERPLDFGNRPRNFERAVAKEKARHKIEEIYYQDGEIRTQRIIKEEYNVDVAANLSQIYSWHSRPTSFSAQERKHIVDFFKAGMATGVPPIETILMLVATQQLVLQDLKCVLYQSIWKRELRVDLFQPVLIDRPLLPETRDVLAEYSAWFNRC